MRRALTNAPLPQVLRTSAFVIGAAYGMIRMPMLQGKVAVSLGVFVLAFPRHGSVCRLRHGMDRAVGD